MTAHSSNAHRFRRTANPRTPASTGSVEDFFTWTVEQIDTWLRISRERRLLGQADERTLSDIGVGRAEAEREAMRPFWDVPTNR